MHLYKVILNFDFQANTRETCINYSSDEQMRAIIARKYDETADYFAANGIERHVKRRNATEFIEYIFFDCRVIDAQWMCDDFKMEVTVETYMEIDEFTESLMFVSLADGEWESTIDNGWTVKLINNDDNYEYGVTTYQEHPPIITEMHHTS